MRTKLIGLTALAATLALAACNKAGDDHTTNEIGPQDSAVGQAMPDTSADRAPDALQTAPDAAATGVIPSDGSAPPVAPTPADGANAVTPSPK